MTGIDVYPTNELPDDQPDNLEIEAWDLNQPLTPTYKPNEYDLIHSRLVAPGIKRDRWRGYIRDIVRLLKRGGWVQMAEFYYIIQSDSGMLTDDHALMQWSNGYRYTMERDRDPRVGRHLGQLMRAAGLVDVQEVTYRMPIGGWSTGKELRLGMPDSERAWWACGSRLPSSVIPVLCNGRLTGRVVADPKLQWVGQQNLDNIGTMLDSLAIWPFTERMGWSKEQVAALTQRARAEAADLRLKLYIPL